MVRLLGLFLRGWFDGNAQLDPVIESFELLDARELLSKSLNALQLAYLDVEVLDKISLGLFISNVVERDCL